MVCWFSSRVCWCSGRVCCGGLMACCVLLCVLVIVQNYSILPGFFFIFYIFYLLITRYMQSFVIVKFLDFSRGVDGDIEAMVLPVSNLFNAGNVKYFYA